MKKCKYAVEVMPKCDSMEFPIEAKGRNLARKAALKYIKDNLNDAYEIFAIREILCSCGCSSCALHPTDPFTYGRLKK